MAQKKKNTSTFQKRRLEMKKFLWPDLTDEKQWSPQKGWLIIPRAMPLILRIMDMAAPKGKPVSQTYLDLWCRTWENDSFVIASKTKEMAFYSGFSGERAGTTWATRIRILKELGFIDFKEGTSGSIHYILILNPYQVIQDLHGDNKIQDMQFNALKDKMIEIGAEDLKE